MTEMSVLIGRCSLDSVNEGCLNFRYTNKDQSKNSTEIHQRKKWTREDDENVIHCYCKSNSTQKKV